MISKNIVSGFIFFLVFFGSLFPVTAEIRLPRLLCDNMVLQRNQEVKIWGWADRSEEIKVSFLNKNYFTRANGVGEWEIELPAQKAGGSHEIAIFGTNTIILKNILFGDVWVCSGQSNMYFKVKGAKDSYLDINAAHFDNIRLFNIEKDSNYIALEDLHSGRWEVCSPETVSDFSAVAYFFGREVQQHLNVPVGLIHSSWGGSNIQAWMDGNTLKEFESYRETVEELECTPGYFQNMMNSYEDKGGNLWLSEYFIQEPGLTKDGDLSIDGFFEKSSWNEMTLPGYWEDCCLPDFDGTVWFRKKIALPEAFQSKDLVLNLGWIDDYDISFVNGKKVGSTFYKGTGRKYIIPEEINVYDSLEIAIAVYDSYSKGGFWGPNRISITLPEDDQLFNIDLKGIWQWKRGLNINDFDARMTSNPKPMARSLPSFLYNAMIAPLTNAKIKGVIWYQGEGNTGKPKEYKKLFQAMIEGWKEKWGQEDFSFLFVQLANYGLASSMPDESNWAELRRSQEEALDIPYTGMAVAIDLGNAMDVHPTNKQDVGKRLALAARYVGYQEDIVHSGPIYESMDILDGKLSLKFKNSGSGLIADNKYGYLYDFSIAGENNKFYWANAFIEGDRVIVYSKEVPNPVNVRYAWSDNPDKANLYNKEGLPAVPFRTDK